MGLFYFGSLDTATPQANVMTWLHQEVFFYLVLVSILVLVLMVELLSDFWVKFNHPVSVLELDERRVILSGIANTHSSRLEIVWTMFPSLVLFLIAIPSLDLLYTFDQIMGWSVCLKVVGHQWYWSYEIVGALKMAL
jgi:heme/copper-type cytochrome/quinol oxidase subunit 2